MHPRLRSFIWPLWVGVSHDAVINPNMSFRPETIIEDTGPQGLWEI